MVRLPLPVTEVEGGYMSLVWGCRTHDNLVDLIAQLFSEQPHALEEFTEQEFAAWLRECADLLPRAEMEMLEQFTSREVVQRAYRHRHDRVVWHATWENGRWGAQDFLNGVRIQDDDFRRKVITDGLIVLDERDRLAVRIEDEYRRELQEPPGGRDGWPGLWAGDRGRNGHRERT